MQPVLDSEATDLMDAAREALERSKPYSEGFDLEVIEATSELVRVRMPFSERLTRFNSTLHGGAIMTLADAAGVVCATLTVRGELAGTQQFNISFLRPVSGGHLDAVARTVHSGRTSLVLETMLEDAEGRTVGLVTQTQAVRGS
jgi:1,4-dihydroxy-2-naphthoyl-CoA hydrolase